MGSPPPPFCVFRFNTPRFEGKFGPRHQACFFQNKMLLHQFVQRLATGWAVGESHPGGGEPFRTCSDRPWGPPNLLYDGYNVQWPKRGVNHPSPCSAEVKERAELYLCSPYWPSQPVLVQTLPILVTRETLTHTNKERGREQTPKNVVKCAFHAEFKCRNLQLGRAGTNAN